MERIKGDRVSCQGKPNLHHIPNRLLLGGLGRLDFGISRASIALHGDALTQRAAGWGTQGLATSLAVCSNEQITLDS